MDTTADLSLPAGAPAGALNTISAALLTNHSVLGQPMGAIAQEHELPEEICWNARYRVGRRVGEGAQGVVYLAEREGADGYSTQCALKVFHEPADWSHEQYVAEMQRIALQARYVSRIQHDNLINIRDFVAIDDTRVMVLEWIDGFDLQRLLSLNRMQTLRAELPSTVSKHLADVIVTPGRDHCRLKSGIAVDILRGCLAGLAALHQKGIAHCDLKPSNIMIKRTGTKKIIDMDSSAVLAHGSRRLRGTPYYMAPEQLADRTVSTQSDIAALGYLLIEMLTGQLLFAGCRSKKQLLAAKLSLPERLYQVLPLPVLQDPFLFEMIQKMVAVDPKERFPDAAAAEFGRGGAARFHRHLVQTNLSADYDRELAWWLRLLRSEG